MDDVKREKGVVYLYEMDLPFLSFFSFKVYVLTVVS